jgi:Opioid growth factor receptor (OGFr) conserved region
MLRFYGLEVVESDATTIERATFFAECSERWLKAGNHNHLRITRILKSLRILGLENEALAFFECLAEIYGDETGKHLSCISSETFHFWRSAASRV